MADPRDLAALVDEVLRSLGRESPGRAVIARCIDAVFFASLRMEESRPVLAEIVYVDPANPDPDPPPIIRSPRWRFFPIEPHIRLTVSNLAKLAMATDGRSSSLAVFAASARIVSIVGILDEGTGHAQLRIRRLGFLSPGQFRIAAIGQGRVAAYIDAQLIGELAGNELLQRPSDIFADGPVAAMLEAAAVAAVSSETDSTAAERFDFAQWVWIDSIARLLVRMRGHGHGGALLLTEGPPPPESVNIKYPLQYNRLSTSLTTRFAKQREFDAARERVFSNRGTRAQSETAWRKYLHAQHQLQDSKEEIDGTLWFMSLLSRVDGAVCLDLNLGAFGFGGEILDSTPPARIVLARDAQATSVKAIPYERWGTRHRSMMRAVYSNAGSLGLVVSQDGDVRAMTRREDDVIVWDGFQLAYDQAAEDAAALKRRQARRAKLRRVQARS